MLPRNVSLGQIVEERTQGCDQCRTPMLTLNCFDYPNDLLPDFIRFVEEDWLPNQCERYLTPRDPAAIPYLPKVIAGPAASATPRRISIPKTVFGRLS